MELPVSASGNTSRWLPWHAIVVFAFLYLPIVTLIVYSFNGSGVGGFPPRNLTLDWYRMLFADDAIWESVLNSLIVALAAMAISLTFGIPAALALDRANFPGKALFRRLVLLPLILPGIITGLSLLMLFREADVKLSLLTIVLGHGTALISVATTEVFRRLAETGSRARGSLARSRRKLLADVLASNDSQLALIHHWRRVVDLHAVHGRDRGQLLSDWARQHVAAGNLGTAAEGDHAGDQCHFHHHFCFFSDRDRELVPAEDGFGRNAGSCCRVGRDGGLIWAAPTGLEKELLYDSKSKGLY